MLYSDKLRISVLNLTRIDLATEEDKSYHIDYWASPFKSTTWGKSKCLHKKIVLSTMHPAPSTS